ncbi:glycosyltransferase [Leucobacter sp. M11]|uniref:glycosyltransferase n=1 Tax=Leucobacter sp. M11 TaxID=2993565 RepID=UPI002D7EB563|nr:glycosyltransferase family 2 protein [Leucobacter sp. M11]MEB4616667.1 glycosyltransferase family 2 protein [Leucobacter sp. M11]
MTGPVVDALVAGLAAAGVVILLFGALKLLAVPLSLLFEVRAAHERARGDWTLLDATPSVTVVVPGYNEGLVIDSCVASIAQSRYPGLEIILVDDGSTDDTAARMARLAERHERVRFIGQENAGKGAALNRGAASATGEVLLFVDADGIFGPDTVEHILAGFTDAGVGAVCGDDRPVNLNRVQTQLLTVISHIGTGLVRRALTVLWCMPIVSGNIGAFRRDVLEQTGPLDEHTLGEDLELTWRVYRAGYRVNFTPRALVYAESPATIAGLWKQRVRWARGLLQTIRTHRAMLGNPRYGVFGLFLVLNLITMVLIPVLQLVVLTGIPLLLAVDSPLLPHDLLGVIGLLGLVTAAVLAVYAMGLNRAWGDLRYLWTLPLWPIYSVFVGATMLVALIQEARGRPGHWNKLDRTGVVTVREARRLGPGDTRAALTGGRG